MQKILLLEDDFHLAEDIKVQLKKEGFETDVYYDGLLAEKAIQRSPVDCIVLDINVPGKSGYEVCKSIRSNGVTAPVLMLTAFGEVEDKLEGFDSGADDYLTKPFYFKELLARIKALLKRGQSKGIEEQRILIKDLVIDLNKKIVTRNSEPIKLTAREFEILTALALEKNNPVSKKELITKIWGTSVDVNTNTIEVFINSLRNKVDKGHTDKLIHTKVGFGYYISTSAYEA